MESSGSYRRGLLTAGGILSIIRGAVAVMAGGAGVGLTIANMDMVTRWVTPSMYTEIYAGMIRGAILAASFFCCGYSRHCRWRIGCEKENLWPVLSWGYLRPVINESCVVHSW
jgi:hypothetical protein